VKRIELLSPAKDFETGKAAIDFGADAVYIGAQKFSARSAAGNEVAAIEKLAAYAHSFHARVYAVVNTLLFDNELDEAQKIITALYEAGVDALIIQDMGICELDIPKLPLFASTQCHNNELAKIQFLEKAGFSRVILARELSIQQIKDIAQQTHIELESFVHGALCVCYSGQCYMSYANGGRSGNRGACAQPCRKKYTLRGDNEELLAEGHLLSLKDMNLSAHLSQMIDAGISSFKIEGRLKDINYVKNVTAHYRNALDAVLEKKDLKKSSSGTHYFDFIPDPLKTFNRGYSDYFINKRNKIAEWRSPKFVGEPTGSVVGVKNDGWMHLESTAVFHPGDGITFYDRNNELKGSYISHVRGSEIKISSDALPSVQTKIYRNFDSQFIKALEKSKTERAISVNILVRQSDDYIAITATDEDDISVEVRIHADQKADDSVKMAETMKDNISRSGGTLFKVISVEIDGQLSLFVPASKINSCRRELLGSLEKARSSSFMKMIRNAEDASARYPYEKIGFEGNVLNKKARDFYLRHGVLSIEPAAESGRSMKGSRVMTCRYCIGFEMGWCRTEKSKSAYRLKGEGGESYTVLFDCNKCVMEIYFEGSSQ
jgi:23S rRNA 5-hydroxycytidine C2501 synthase